VRLLQARTRQPSLQRQLLIWLLLPLLVLVPATSAVLYLLAVRPALDGLDRALTDTAVALAQIVELRDGQVQLPLSAQTERALKADLVDEIFFAVGDGRGQRLAGHPLLLPLAPAPALAQGEWRFFESRLDGRDVRVAAHAVACGPAGSLSCPILVAETVGKRSAAKQSVWLAALLGATLLAATMVLLATFAVARGMRPLRQAAADIAARTPDRLEPVDPRAVPREVMVFVEALNQLFARLREAVAAQRAFVADAAHQLRTPLAVLRVEAAQLLEAPHPPELHAALERLHAAAERGARLAQQLLALARTESSALDPGLKRAPVDLRALAARAADRWLQPSLQAGQDLGFELAPAWVDGDPMLLEELLGNLVQNAIEHADRGTRITIRTAMEGPVAVLRVEDDGPGVAPDERAQIWQRFHRGRAARGTGSGLGLAIVQDIARLHGARATLDAGDEGRGLRVTVRFPPPQTRLERPAQ
jgi:two-component system sensor histidine kinase TctE